MRWCRDSVLAIEAEPRCPHPRRPEKSSVLTPSQARSAVGDEDPEAESGEEDGEMEDIESRAVAPEVSQEDEEQSGAKLGQPEVRDEDEKVRRDFKVTKKLLGRFGPTDGCKACRLMIEGGKAKGWRHTHQCRRRIEERMKTSEEFKDILKKRDQRHNLAPQDEEEDELEQRQVVEQQTLPKMKSQRLRLRKARAHRVMSTMTTMTSGTRYSRIVMGIRMMRGPVRNQESTESRIQFEGCGTEFAHCARG